MKLPSLKHRKPIVYISLSIYVLLITFIIVEACIEGGLSGLQSQLIAQWSALFVNKATGPQISEVLKPADVVKAYDSSYLGEGNIAIGTTTLVSYRVDYPNKSRTDDIYDKAFTVSPSLGNEDDYSLVLSSHVESGNYYVDIRIVANAMNSDLYKLDLTVAETITKSYEFSIVEKPAPSDSDYELKLDKSTLKKGETEKINIKLKLKEGRTIPNGLTEKNVDTYIRRYFDVTKLNYSSSNEAVATIDKYGVIHAKEAGNANITFGKESYQIEVLNQSINIPATNSLELSVSDSANNALNLLDYDSVFETGEESSAYSVVLYPDFDDATLEDQSVTFEVNDPLMAMVAPYSYDNNGYPVYKDGEGKGCVRICGYRKKGTGIVYVTAYSNVDNTISRTIPLLIKDATATSMEVTGIRNKVYVNEFLTLQGKFAPKNTFLKSLNVACDNPELVTIIGNDTELVSIKANKIGTCHIIVTSNSNNTLIKEFDLTIDALNTINETNYDQFHSWMRKFAGHFFLFLTTAVFGAIFFVTYFQDNKKMFIYVPVSLFIGFAVAGISEFIQRYVKSRTPSWQDVGIDFFGYAIGTIVCIGIVLIIAFVKSKKKKDS